MLTQQLGRSFPSPLGVSRSTPPVMGQRGRAGVSATAPHTSLLVSGRRGGLGLLPHWLVWRSSPLRRQGAWLGENVEEVSSGSLAKRDHP